VPINIYSSQNEIEKLRSQLHDMRVRCEKAEKEKSEILLRRLTTMETMSNKTSTSEVTKLQKKNEGIHFSKFIENSIEIFYKKILYIILSLYLI